MSGERRWAHCPRCDVRDLPLTTEETAEAVVEDHNEIHHDGEDVAEIREESA